MIIIMTHTLVTGASQNHFKSVCQLLTSTYSRPMFDIIIVYDLGLTEESYQYIAKHFKVILRKFDYSRYPSFFDINVNCGEYAWKPALLWEAAQEVKEGLLLWCDAGNVLTEESYHVFPVIKRQGIYSPISLGSVDEWTHPRMQSFFNIGCHDPVLCYPPRNGAILGFDLDQPAVIEFMKEFNRLAHIKECIAPEGSSRANHRQDQALFTILYYQYSQYNLWEIEQYGTHTHIDID